MPTHIDYSKRDLKKDFLTLSEITSFLHASKSTRHSARDYALSLICFRHGLRVSELISLTLADLDLRSAHLSVHRLKNGLSTIHPLQPDETRALAHYLKSRPDSPFDHLFLSERGPFTRRAINYLVETIAKKAKLPFHVNPHMLRHSTGYHLANKGLDIRLIQDYLGHRDIQSTVRYTRVNPERFKSIWK